MFFQMGNFLLMFALFPCSSSSMLRHLPPKPGEAKALQDSGTVRLQLLLASVYVDASSFLWV